MENVNNASKNLKIYLNPFQLSKELIIKEASNIFLEKEEELEKESIPSIFYKLREKGKEKYDGNFKQEIEKFFVKIFYENELLPNSRSAKFLGKVLAIDWLKREGFKNPKTIENYLNELKNRLYTFSDAAQWAKDDPQELIEVVDYIGIDIIKTKDLSKYANFMDIMIYFENEKIFDELDTKLKGLKRKYLKEFTVDNLKKIGRWEIASGLGDVEYKGSYDCMEIKKKVNTVKNPFWPIYNIYKRGFLIGKISDSIELYDKNGECYKIPFYK